MTGDIETAVKQYLRLSRLHESGDISIETAGRGFRALRASFTEEQWAEVRFEACARQLEAAGWKVKR